MTHSADGCNTWPPVSADVQSCVSDSSGLTIEESATVTVIGQLGLGGQWVWPQLGLAGKRLPRRDFSIGDPGCTYFYIKERFRRRWVFSFDPLMSAGWSRLGWI